MILDANLIFSEDQAVTATAISANVVQFPANGIVYGETAANAALSSGAVVLATSGAIPVASLLAGFRPTFTRVLPDGEIKEFLGLRYTVGGSNATAGQISAALATEVNT